MKRLRLYRSLIPGRSHIFIDCGGSNGCSIRRFMAQFDPKGRYEMVTFEPNELYRDCYSSFARHSLIEAAVHDRDGSRQFFLDREDGDGSTLFANKLTRADGGYGTLDTANPVIVQTIDLSLWILENTRPRDYVILKLDVEGAEYDILEKMIRDRSIKRLAHLFIEWHWNKVAVPWERHDAVVQDLRRLRLPVLEWDAYGF
jgi:FkbM family methyltransferase